MGTITALNKKQYDFVVAENYLCVPAMLEMILNADNFKEFDKYTIANSFGVFLPLHTNYTKISNYYHSDDPRQLGIIIKENSINKFFKDYSLPFMEQYIRINLIYKDLFTDYVDDILPSGKHIICGYKYNTLHGIDDNYADHVSIIVDTDKKMETISLLDSGLKEPGLKIVSAYTLYNTICVAKDGLWIITRRGPD